MLESDKFFMPGSHEPEAEPACSFRSRNIKHLGLFYAQSADRSARPGRLKRRVVNAHITYSPGNGLWDEWLYWSMRPEVRNGHV